MRNKHCDFKRINVSAFTALPGKGAKDVQQPTHLQEQKIGDATQLAWSGDVDSADRAIDELNLILSRVKHVETYRRGLGDRVNQN